ncbi:MAG TPA: DUF4097 family beta strand repeat-containing protein [Anaerolineae bacterium]|nr:DUF4097 family beta strand repeat-containing protein [Anaerolineae bacterium]
MESKNRNIWIIVAVIVVALCCCTLAVAAVAVGLFSTQPFAWTWSTNIQRARSEEAFAVGDAPDVQIDNFAGNVTVRTGESGLVRVAATRQARSRNDLDRVKVQISERDGGLVIKTEKPMSLTTASVDLEITAPAGTRLQVDTGAGNVEIDGITGGIDAYSGAGDTDVRGAAGTARLDTGAGSIRYQGTPQGECSFETGAGNITLALPADVNVQVDLGTGVGNVDVGFVVDGQVSRQSVQGVIGSGAQGTIYAHTGAGNIDVVRR